MRIINPFAFDSGGGFTPFDCGINFRATSGYVTDGTNETYCEASDTYPTTRDGYTFGWDSSTSVSELNRNSGVDRRLAGINYLSKTNTTRYFRLDLPSAGTYEIHLAVGDVNNSTNCGCIVRDGAGTTLIELTGDTSGNARFKDATDTEYTTATWPTSESGSSHSVSNDYITLKVSASASGNSVSNVKFAHLRVVRTA